MRHRKAFRKFSRTPSHRKSMFANMVMALVENGRIKTTEAKAKELRRVAERMVTMGCQARAAAANAEDPRGADRLASAKRKAFAELRYPGKHKKGAPGTEKGDAKIPRSAAKGGVRAEDDLFRAERVVEALFGDLADRFASQPGGYTRVVKLGNRVGDNAPMAYLEFIDYEPPAFDEDEDEDEGEGGEG